MSHSSWEHKLWSYKFLASYDQTVDTPAKFNDLIGAIANSSFVKEKPEWTYPRKPVKRISSSDGTNYITIIRPMIPIII